LARVTAIGDVERYVFRCRFRRFPQLPRVK
jgi:hypothetical protein